MLFLATPEASKDGELLGIFMNSAKLANYEHVYMRANEDNPDYKEEKDADPRTTKVTKALDSINDKFELADKTSSHAYNFQLVNAEATLYARHLTETRGSVANPEYMEQKIRELIAGNDKCELVVLDEDKLQSNGMMLFYNVGKEAPWKPRCVIVKYTGNPASKDIDAAFVGKGVTYDTGGLNLKMAMMEEMHGDKGGSCAVIGALHGTMAL